MSHRGGGSSHRNHTGTRGGARGGAANGSSSSSGYGRGGGRGGGGGGGGPNSGACFRCGQTGHIARDCPSPMSGPRGGGGGGGRGGRGGFKGNLDVNIDGRMKTDIWQILKEFQENPDMESYSFPPDLTNTDRRYIHTCCRNLNLTSKSTGGSKGSATRYIVVYKGAEVAAQKKLARKHPLSTLAFQSQASAPLVDGFLHAYPLPEDSVKERLDDEPEIDLHALAARYTPRKSEAEVAALSAQLQRLQQAREAAQSAATSDAPMSELQSFRTRLPIYAQKDTILRMIDENPVVVLSSSTGSGKSTQVPQYLLDHLDARGLGGKTDMIVTQPRRISAISLAQRVAEEREVAGESIGDTVGYQIRLEARKSAKTRLLYCTIGVLLRRLASDRLLSGVSHIVVDEVHERDRLCDFLLVVLRDLLVVRKDLKLILMSATLNADMFSGYFGHCPHIHIEGFTFPVHTFYLEDVVELIGYTPPTLNKAEANKRRQQQDLAKEKKLADQLNFTLSQLLTLETVSAADQAKKSGVVLNPSSSAMKEENGDDEAAMQALANIAAMSGNTDFGAAAFGASSSSASAGNLLGMPLADNKVTGWTDTYTYKPSVENPWADGSDAPATNGAANGDEANMLSALSNIVAGTEAEAAASLSAAPAPNSSGARGAPVRTNSAPPVGSAQQLHPSAVSASALTSSLSLLAKPAKTQVLQNPLSGLKYSQETLDAIAKIEEEGMDFIDYDLILSVIVFICNKFDGSLLGGAGVASSARGGGGGGGKKGRRGGRGGAAGAGAHAADAHARQQAEEAEDDSINIYNGSILVFLPGWEDICKLLDMVAEHPVLSQNRKYMVLPLHGSISTQQQRLIFQRPLPGQRKIIFSTNIAETSVTIDDVVFVLDSGKMKEKSYDAYTKMCALSSTWVAQSNAKQRSGRAGRCRRGVCFRLYTTGMYEKMDAFQTPELLRTPLEEICLQVKQLKLGKIASFLAKALQPPSPVAVLDATDLLTRLGALDPSTEALTTLGDFLASMPLDPRLAKMILYGAVFKCLDPVLTVAACLSYRDPFVLPVAYERERAQAARQRLSNGSHSDMLTLLHAYHGYTAALNHGGPRAANDFARNHFLSVPTMQMIAKLKVQFMDTLKETGWLDHLVQPGAGSGAPNKHRGAHRSGEQSAQTRAALRHLDCTTPSLNQHQHNLAVLSAVICLGMYPMCARVQVQSSSKKRRALLCTRNDLHNVCLHPSSVSCKDFRRCASHNSAWTEDGRINLADDGMPDDIVQYCVFFESMRSSEIFLRSVHWVQPILLALFGTGNRAAPKIKHQLSSKASPSPSAEPSSSPSSSPPVIAEEKKKSKGARSSSPQEGDAEAGEDDENEDDDEDDDDEDDYEGSDDDYDAEDNTIFHADEWVRFACAPVDAARFAQLRRYLSFILDAFIRRSGAGRGSVLTTPAQVHMAEQSVEFLVKLMSQELAPKGMPQGTRQQHHAHNNNYAPRQQPYQQQYQIQQRQQPYQQQQQQPRPQAWQSSPAQPPSRPTSAASANARLIPTQVLQRQVPAPAPAPAAAPAPAPVPAPMSVAPVVAVAVSAPVPAPAPRPVQQAALPVVPPQALTEAELIAKMTQLQVRAADELQQHQQQQQRPHHAPRQHAPRQQHHQAAAHHYPHHHAAAPYHAPPQQQYQPHHAPAHHYPHPHHAPHHAQPQQQPSYYAHQEAHQLYQTAYAPPAAATYAPLQQPQHHLYQPPPFVAAQQPPHFPPHPQGPGVAHHPAHPPAGGRIRARRGRANGQPAAGQQ